MMAVAQLAILIRYLNIFVLILDFACEGVSCLFPLLLEKLRGSLVIVSDV